MDNGDETVSIWKSAELAGRRPVVNNLRNGSHPMGYSWPIQVSSAGHAPRGLCGRGRDPRPVPPRGRPVRRPAGGLGPLAARADRHDHGSLVKKECISLAAARPSHICTYSGISVGPPGRRGAASSFLVRVIGLDRRRPTRQRRMASRATVVSANIRFAL